MGEHRVRVLGYARVSVGGEDLGNQVSAIEEYCRERGYELLGVVEDTVTGASRPMEREGFRRLVDMARVLGVDRVVVASLDRVARGGVQEAYEILSLLRGHGVRVEFARAGGLDLSNPIVYDTFIFAFGLAAELERRAMRARMEDARRAGKRIGRPPYEIPWQEVERYLSMGLSVKDVYRILVAAGKLRRVTRRGAEATMSYRRFLHRVKTELPARQKVTKK